jgi:NRAMP (natural resistance-associated macrophage protein)-like metal ion transporter
MHQRWHAPRWNRVRAARAARAGAQQLGPGLITGVADDDPSGISTYTITGATYGYQLLWMSLFTLPLNIAVQSVCARIGLVTGRGLGSVIATRYGRRLLLPVTALLLIANVINIGADIQAIASVIELLTRFPAPVLVLPLGASIALVEVVMPYAQFARYLKLLTLVIFAYVIGAFVAQPDWGAALGATLAPRLTLERGSIATIVAILGTTISPYLFFWQASEEVEEEEQQGVQVAALSRQGMLDLLRASRVDVTTGMLLANIGFYFVVLTSAATLHATGRTDVQTAAQAAEALRPLAGNQAALLFALGIIGTGLLAVPVLAGSSAYAVSELCDWPEGLNTTFRRSPQFYGVIAIATLLGCALSFSHVSEMRALYLAAIANGLIAPVLLLVIMAAAGDRRVLGEHVCSRGVLLLGWVTTAVMLLAALALLVLLVLP